MKCLDLTLPTPAENLACDEALLDWCEEQGGAEVLRFWEPREHFVVVGYANISSLEVNATACEANGIPVYRRCSGGGTVLQGPGCLNYSLVMRFDEPPRFSPDRVTGGNSSEGTSNIEHRTLNSERENGENDWAVEVRGSRFEVQSRGAAALHSITAANRFIMQRNRAALAGIVSNSEMQVRGHTDLTVGGLKFSGNAQRRRKHCLLFHGTFLLDFDIALIEKFLSMPSRQPAYRRNRAHADFLTNLGVSADAVKSAMQKTWQAHESPEGFPIERARLLASDKYVTKEWNCKF